jgi:hypothetical protein
MSASVKRIVPEDQPVPIERKTFCEFHAIAARADPAELSRGSQDQFVLIFTHRTSPMSSIYRKMSKEPLNNAMILLYN